MARLCAAAPLAGVAICVDHCFPLMGHPGLLRGLSRRAEVWRVCRRYSAVSYAGVPLVIRKPDHAGGLLRVVRGALGEGDVRHPLLAGELNRAVIWNSPAVL